MSYLMAEDITIGAGINQTQTVRIYKSGLITGVRVGFLKVYHMTPGNYLSWTVSIPTYGSLNGAYSSAEIESMCPGNGWNGMLKLNHPELDAGIPIRVVDEYVEIEISLSTYGAGFSYPSWIGWVRDEKPQVETYGNDLPSTFPEQDMWLNPYKVEIYTE